MMTLKRLSALLVVTALSIGAMAALSTPADAYVRGCGWRTAGWHYGWHRGWHRYGYAGAPIVASDYVAAPVVATDYVAPAPACTTGCGRPVVGSCGYGGWGTYGGCGGGGLFGGLLPF